MEKFDLENFPTSESAKKMLSYVSNGFYDKSYVGKWIFQIMGIEYDKALEKATDLPAQFFPETATWGLMYHEIKWGLPVRLNLSYEERRRLIYQKRDYRLPITPYHMENYIANATGFDVCVADIHDTGEYDYYPAHPNMFKVFLKEHEKNTKVEYAAVEAIVLRLKQSHTTFEIEHKQEFERISSIFSDAVMTEYVEYDIQPRNTNKDLEVIMMIDTVVALDEIVMEEV